MPLEWASFGSYASGSINLGQHLAPRKHLIELLSFCFFFLFLGSPGFWNIRVTHTDAILFVVLDLVLVMLDGNLSPSHMPFPNNWQ